MDTTVYFVRHTEVHNPENIMYGRLPGFRLSILGRQQVTVTAKVLAGVPVTAFYTSPLLRALQTTRAIARRHPGVPVIKSFQLDEIRTAWQGSPRSALQEINWNFYDKPKSDNDETLAHIGVRIGKFVERVRRAHHGGVVVAVTHGDVFGVARALFTGFKLTPEAIREPHPYPFYGALLKLTFHDRDETLPGRVEFYDVLGSDPRWSGGWVVLERIEADL